jgi:hypothetical protein
MSGRIVLRENGEREQRLNRRQYGKPEAEDRPAGE